MCSAWATTGPTRTCNLAQKMGGVVFEGALVAAYFQQKPKGSHLFCCSPYVKTPPPPACNTLDNHLMSGEYGGHKTSILRCPLGICSSGSLAPQFWQKWTIKRYPNSNLGTTHLRIYRACFARFRKADSSFHRVVFLLVSFQAQPRVKGISKKEVHGVELLKVAFGLPNPSQHVAFPDERGKPVACVWPFVFFFRQETSGKSLTSRVEGR